MVPTVRKRVGWMRLVGSSTLQGSYKWAQAGRVNYLDDGRRVIQERDLNNVPTVSYTRGTDLSGTLEGAGGIGGLLARSDGYSSGSFTNHDYYQGDGNGNITRMIDANQTVVATYKYDPFGNTLSQSGDLADTNVYQFSSKERMQIYPAQVGTLYYYGYRFYSPHFQRWPNRDPADDWGSIVNHLQNVRDSDIDFNLYRFAGNAPSIYVDELGLKWHAGGKWDGKDDSIVCDDKGGIRPALTKNTQCGCDPAKKCRIEHEMSHAADVLAENPDICKGKKDGTQIYTYSTKQKNASERKAYDKEIDCIRKSAAEFNKQCSESADDYIKQLEKDRKRYE